MLGHGRAATEVSWAVSVHQRRWEQAREPEEAHQTLREMFDWSCIWNTAAVWKDLCRSSWRLCQRPRKGAWIINKEQRQYALTCALHCRQEWATASWDKKYWAELVSRWHKNCWRLSKLRKEVRTALAIRLCISSETCSNCLTHWDNSLTWLLHECAGVGLLWLHSTNKQLKFSAHSVSSYSLLLSLCFHVALIYDPWSI